MIKLTLPYNVKYHFTNSSHGTETLLKEEAEIIKDFGPKRLKDFCSGRYCAHQCLESFALTEPILRYNSGAPVWPENLTGSISHSQEWAGAMVGPKSSYLAMGLDIETIGRVTQDLWHLFFNPSEIAFLESRAGKYQELFSTILYSMKETFFKLQFQITQEFLEFKDCEISSHWGQFFVAPKIDLGNQVDGRLPLNYEVYKDQVITYGVFEKD